MFATPKRGSFHLNSENPRNRQILVVLTVFICYYGTKVEMFAASGLSGRTAQKPGPGTIFTDYSNPPAQNKRRKIIFWPNTHLFGRILYIIFPGKYC
jgi:hypothetical protein